MELQGSHASSATGSHHCRHSAMAPAAKRRKLEASVVEEVVWDPTARHDYLTGFHKRKLQRAKHAQEAAERRARQDKIAERKRVSLEACYSRLAN